VRRLALGAVVLAGCSTVKGVRVRSDYDAVDRTRTVRLTVVVAPLPEGGAPVGELGALVARRYVNQHRDFIVRRQLAAAALPADACQSAEGVLHLEPVLRREGRSVRAELHARLTRCRDGEEVWSAQGAGTWDSDDDQLKELTKRYVEELGEAVRPYAAPAFRLLRAVLDTLPRPKLPDDAAVMEKIDLGE
jgi:probable lipoprotein (TIGR04455 family)